MVAFGVTCRKAGFLPAALTDFALEIAKDPLEIGFVEVSVEELIPEPFPAKAQAHALAGQTHYNACA
jgi:hypothetical protein